MNAIFTICAKNYLAHAISLGDSVKVFDPSAAFFILLSDEIDGNIIDTKGHVVVEAKDIGIPDYYQLAYKYDVIEFSTCVKPFFFSYLFLKNNYEKIMFFDPDTLVFNTLDYLWNKLDDYIAILTPHLIKPYIENFGVTTEEELLFVGIYNLGFFGIKRSSEQVQIIEWWKNKLYDKCFADKEDALHVDQRWMDFLPALYREKIFIIDHSGINIAFWNFHERNFKDLNNTYEVDGQKLLLFHFSGFDHNNLDGISRKQEVYSLTNDTQYRRIFTDYLNTLRGNGLDFLANLEYKYNQYDNDVFIIRYQRRLFRALSSNEKKKFYNPFSTVNGTFYSLLLKNKLIIEDRKGELMVLKKKFVNHELVLNKLFLLLRLFKKLVGIRRYYLFMRFMTMYHRFERQSFLINKN